MNAQRRGIPSLTRIGTHFDSKAQVLKHEWLEGRIRALFAGKCAMKQFVYFCVTSVMLRRKHVPSMGLRFTALPGDQRITRYSATGKCHILEFGYQLDMIPRDIG